MTTSDDRELSERTSRVLRAQRQQRTLPAKLEALAGLAQRALPNCDAASIALLVRGDAGTAAWSSEIAIEADLAQYRCDDGPCLLSVNETHPVRIDVMEHDERFVHFAPLALDLGIESVFSMPLESSGDVVGSLNLYSQTRDAFGDATGTAVEAIAGYAADLIAASPLYVYTLELLEHLELTIQARDTIETAVGMLMATHRCNEATAMSLLRNAAAEDDQDLEQTARIIIAANAEPSRGAIDDH